MGGGSTIPFAKLQGAGNGYVVIDARPHDADWPELARCICDPHLGVGSDGLALVVRSEVAPVGMRIINSDGSESEMSGNGIRLFAKFVLDRGLARAGHDGLEVETGGGVRTVWPVVGPGGMESARVAMGVPAFVPAEIPMSGPGVEGAERMIDFPLEVAGTTLPVTCLSIGNPHAVAILDTAVDTFALEELGPAVVAHPFFPNRINFEIVNVMDRGAIRARIFERGEGETLASGTGSTASMIASHLHGLVDDEVTVRLRGGDLRVRWAGAGEAELEGPAVEVFSGDWPLG
jgi:diaminopimelate epimerase